MHATPAPAAATDRASATLPATPNDRHELRRIEPAGDAAADRIGVAERAWRASASLTMVTNGVSARSRAEKSRPRRSRNRHRLEKVRRDDRERRLRQAHADGSRILPGFEPVAATVRLAWLKRGRAAGRPRTAATDRAPGIAASRGGSCS